MLCPNCGTKTTTEHKFRRACGMNLEPAPTVADHTTELLSVEAQRPRARG